MLKGGKMLKMPEYHQLPHSVRFVLKTGEVADFRARLIKEAEDITIIEDAYFIIDGELVGPFNLDVYHGSLGSVNK